jgi:response regulator RpfG family c-di-GMP phosphodiesterase
MPMRNGRPYKKKMNKIEAVMELKRCSGTQFDPDLVEIFIDKVLYSKSADKRVAVG